MVYSAPEGFTHDPNSGLYYLVTPGTDPQTGSPAPGIHGFTRSRGSTGSSFTPDERKAARPGCFSLLKNGQSKLGLNA